MTTQILVLDTAVGVFIGNRYALTAARITITKHCFTLTTTTADTVSIAYAGYSLTVL